MRTNLTQEQVTAIITHYFEDHGSDVQSVGYFVDPRGFNTDHCVIYHTREVKLPESGT